MCGASEVSRRVPRIRTSALLLASLGLACSRPAAPEAPVIVAAAAEPVDLAIRNVRVFDGTTVLASATVEVRAGAVVRVASDGHDAPATTVIDGTGMTLLPGLIDAHTHIVSPDALRQALLFGVTTELDMFAEPTVVRPLRRLTRGTAGAAMADFRSAGTLATAPGGHGTEYGVTIPTLTTPAEAQAFVDARIAEGSDYLKIVYDDGSAFGAKIPTLSRETMRAVIVAAHARGKLAIVHVSSQREAIEAIEAGADGLAHIFFDAAPSRRFVELAAQRKVFVADTLAVIFSICDGTRGEMLIADGEVSPLLPPREAAAGSLRPAVAREQMDAIAARLRTGRGQYRCAVRHFQLPRQSTIHDARMRRATNAHVCISRSRATRRGHRGVRRHHERGPGAGAPGHAAGARRRLAVGPLRRQELSA